MSAPNTNYTETSRFYEEEKWLRYVRSGESTIIKKK